MNPRLKLADAVAALVRNKPDANLYGRVFDALEEMIHLDTGKEVKITITELPAKENKNVGPV